MNINIRGKNLIESVNKISHRSVELQDNLYTIIMLLLTVLHWIVCYSLLYAWHISAAQNGLNWIQLHSMVYLDIQLRKTKN